MDAKEIRENIHDHNFSYLMLAQNLIYQDKPLAMFRLGIDGAMADTLRNLAPSQMTKLSDASQLLCQFRFDEHQTVKLLTQDSRVDELQQLHTGILLSSSFSRPPDVSRMGK
ncbi:flagellar transcriptional regulator FlhD [Acerihabitans sp. TG2]|uniref:flagellar transcriptional regulator FlhD n=1 Tax=Acerihabitans sp. TG2 TaxID=3096008 RepID=UPI002B236FDD|nr:flagellar transcriptional regulator FlhD [Acerihabitans sp. TG2]MEA9389687.1 flagellar transcriptional regulator FlhD [Acerihabitans sp. TG2]